MTYVAQRVISLLCISLNAVYSFFQPVQASFLSPPAVISSHNIIYKMSQPHNS